MTVLQSLSPQMISNPKTLMPMHQRFSFAFFPIMCYNNPKGGETMINILLEGFDIDAPWLYPDLKPYLKPHHRVAVVAFSFRSDRVKSLSDWNALYSPDQGKFYAGIVGGFAAYGIREEHISFLNYFADTPDSAKAKIQSADIIYFPDEPPEKPFVNPFEKPEPEIEVTEEASPEEEESPSEDMPEKKEKKKKKVSSEPEKPNIHALINDEVYEDMNEYCADGAVELTIAVILRELRSGRDVCLMWYDDRSEIGAFCYDMHSIEDFDIVFKLFASAPTVHRNQKISRLAASVGDTNESKVMVVLPALDDEIVDDVCEIPRVTEIIAYSAEERYLYPELRRAFIDQCREQFGARGIKLIDGKLDESSILASESPLEGGEEEKGGTVGVGTLKGTR